MSAKSFLAFVVLSVIVSCCTAQSAKKDEEDCLINGEEVAWNWSGIYGEKIDDNVDAGLIATLTTNGIEEITFGDSKWLSFVYDKNAKTIEVSTTKDFEKYEEEAIGTEIKVMMNIKCTNEHHSSEVAYIQEINDLNTYQPLWNQEEYLFEIYGALPENFDLTNLIQITVTDKDCSPDSLNFYIERDGMDEEDPDFEIDQHRQSQEKDTVVSLRASRAIQAPNDFTYTLRVKDRNRYSEDSEDSKESTAKLRIHLIESEMDFAFVEPEYTINLINNEKVTSDEKIELKEGLDHDIDVIIEDSEYSEFFSVELDHVKGSIKLTLEEPLPKTKSAYAGNTEFTLTLKALWQNREASTVVTVKSDKEVELICYVPVIDIDREYYENPENIDDVSNGIFFTVSDIKNVKSMTCDPKQTYLECKFDADKGVFTMSTTEEFKKYEDIETDLMIKTNLTIECPSDTKTLEFKQNIHDTNNHAPEFLASEYTFLFYNEIPKKFDLTLMHEITVSEKDLTTKNCHFDLDDDKFTISSEKVGKTCVAKVTNVNATGAPFERTIKLVVDDDDGKTAETTLYVKVTKDEEDQPKFKFEEYYFKVLKEHENQTETLTTYKDYEKLTLKNGMDSETKFEIMDKDFAKKFVLKPKILTGILEVQMAKGAELCQGCETVSFPIKATWRGLEAETKLTIIVNEEVTTTSSTTPTDKPTEATDKPTAPTDKPTIPTDKPTEATDKPTTPTDKPTEATDKPTTPTDKPTEATDKPTAPTDKPTEATDKPTAPTDKPTEATDKPTAPTDKPTESTDKPTASTTSPTARPNTTEAYPFDGQGKELEGFGSFMLSSLIGIILMFVVSAVGLCVMIYLIIKRFLIVRKNPMSGDLTVAKLPMKFPV